MPGGKKKKKGPGRRPSPAGQFKAEQDEEMVALEAIYGPDYVADADGHGFTLHIVPHPGQAEDNLVSVDMAVRYPCEYPSQAVVLKLHNSQGLHSDHVRQLARKLSAMAQDHARDSEVCVFNLVSAAVDFLLEHNIKKQSLWHSMIERPPATASDDIDDATLDDDTRYARLVADSTAGGGLGAGLGAVAPHHPLYASEQLTPVDAGSLFPDTAPWVQGGLFTEEEADVASLAVMQRAFAAANRSSNSPQPLAPHAAVPGEGAKGAKGRQQQASPAAVQTAAGEKPSPLRAAKQITGSTLALGMSATDRRQEAAGTRTPDLTPRNGNGSTAEQQAPLGVRQAASGDVSDRPQPPAAAAQGNAAAKGVAAATAGADGADGRGAKGLEQRGGGHLRPSTCSAEPPNIVLHPPAGDSHPAAGKLIQWQGNSDDGSSSESGSQGSSSGSVSDEEGEAGAAQESSSSGTSSASSDDTSSSSSDMDSSTSSSTSSDDDSESQGTVAAALHRKAGRRLGLVASDRPRWGPAMGAGASSSSSRHERARQEELRLHLLVGHLLSLLASRQTGASSLPPDPSPPHADTEHQDSTHAAAAPQQQQQHAASHAQHAGQASAAQQQQQLAELVSFLRAHKLVPRWMAHVLTQQPQWLDMAFNKQFAQEIHDAYELSTCSTHATHTDLQHSSNGQQGEQGPHQPSHGAPDNTAAVAGSLLQQLWAPRPCTAGSVLAMLDSSSSRAGSISLAGSFSAQRSSSGPRKDAGRQGSQSRAHCAAAVRRRGQQSSGVALPE